MSKDDKAKTLIDELFSKLIKLNNGEKLQEPWRIMIKNGLQINTGPGKR